MDTHFVKKQMSNAYRYSFTRLALNLYSYYEISSTAEVEVPQTYQLLESGFIRLLSDYLSGNIPEEQLNSLRGEVMAFMETAVSFAESLQIYEYILNRMERRYLSDPKPVPDEGELLFSLMEYFRESQDSVVMNSRIRGIVGETPIRFTKAKFFGMVKDGLRPYAGASKKVLEDFLEQLTNFTCLKQDAGEESGFEEFSSILAELSEIDFKQMEKNTFGLASGQVALAGEKLSAYVDHCFLLQELINDLYILCLAREDAVMELGEEEIAASIAGELAGLFESDSSGAPEEIATRLVLLEGKQEIYYERYSAAGMEAIHLEKTGDRLWKVDRLMSGSPFLNLETDGDGDTDPADEAWVLKKAEQFCEELSLIFDSLPKPVIRAVMAKILSGLPVWFRSMDEIHDFIRDGLECCTDLCEKESSMELMCNIMETEYALV